MWIFGESLISVWCAIRRLLSVDLTHWEMMKCHFRNCSNPRHQLKQLLIPNHLFQLCSMTLNKQNIRMSIFRISAAYYNLPVSSVYVFKERAFFLFGLLIINFLSPAKFSTLIGIACEIWWWSALEMRHKHLQKKKVHHFSSEISLTTETSLALSKQSQFCFDHLIAANFMLIGQM